jgi:uncharacterized membrane protein
MLGHQTTSDASQVSIARLLTAAGLPILNYNTVLRRQNILSFVEDMCYKCIKSLTYRTPATKTKLT